MDDLLPLALSWQAALASLVVGVAASAYLVVRLGWTGLAVAAGVPVAVVVALVLWAIATPSNDGGMSSPLLGVFLGGWLALLAVPYVLGAVALGVGMWSGARDARTPPVSPSLPPPAGERVHDTVLIVPGPAPRGPAVGTERATSVAFGVGAVVVFAAVVFLFGSAGAGRERDARLRQAFRDEDLALVKTLVRGRRQANASIFDGYAEFPVHTAANQGNPAIVAYLLDQGADPVRKNHWGYTAVTSVFAYNTDIALLPPRVDEVLELLVDHGTPLTEEDVSHVFELPTHARTVAALQRRLFTPERIGRSEPELGQLLRSAMHRDEHDVVCAFLDRGGSVDYRDEGGHPLLVTALYMGKGALARELLGRGADPFAQVPEHRDEQGWVYPAHDGRDHLGKVDLETVKAFLARAPGMDLARADESVVVDALEGGREDVAAYLVDHGADLDAALGYAELWRNEVAIRWIEARRSKAGKKDG